MKKIAKKVRTRPKAQVISNRRKPVATRVRADKSKPDFIGRLEGIIRIVGDIESPTEPPEAWECCREGLNAESTDVLDYQTKPFQFAADAKKRGRGRPRHTS